MDKRQYLKNLRSGHAEIVENFVESIVGYHSNQEIVLSQNCGIYAVGSSLNKNDYGDIDITLVGLDFRNVFVPLIYESLEPPPEWLDPELGLDNTVIVPSRYSQFCLAKFTQRLFDHVEFDYNEFDSNTNPFQKYQSGHGDFLGSRGKKESIDFFVHGENLLVPYWKEHQERQKLRYVTLHEWRDANVRDLSARRIPGGTIPVPDFIDISGETRSRIVCSDLKEVEYVPGIKYDDC